MSIYFAFMIIFEKYGPDILFFRREKIKVEFFDYIQKIYFG